MFVNFVKALAKDCQRFLFISIFLVLRQIQRVLINTFILFMKTEIHCLTQDLFSLLFWTVVSLSHQFRSVFLFYCAIFYLCSSSVFSNFDICFALKKISQLDFEIFVFLIRFLVSYWFTYGGLPMSYGFCCIVSFLSYS